MKLLLDENLPHDLRHEISGHEVFTVKFMGWAGIKNGALLSKAAAAAFDVFLTMDSGVPYQQNIASLSLSVIVLSAPSNDIDDINPLLPKLLRALSTIKPGTVAHVR